MAKTTNKRLHVQMNLTRVDDQSLYDIVAGIVQLAPTSPLSAIPAVQTIVAAIAALGASLKAENDTVAGYRTKLASAVEVEGNVRRALNGELLALKAVVESKSTNAAEIASIGLKERGASQPSGTILPPESIHVRPSRRRGQITVAAHQIGTAKWRYAAESSPDPVGEGAWSNLTGYGKARRLTGPSGAKVWVRFARVQGQSQSAWSTPVLVTIP